MEEISTPSKKTPRKRTRKNRPQWVIRFAPPRCRASKNLSFRKSRERKQPEMSRVVRHAAVLLILFIQFNIAAELLAGASNGLIGDSKHEDMC